MENLSETYLFIFILSEAICLVTGILLSILPHITRKSLLFGVRIPDAAKSEPGVIHMKRIYTSIMVSVTAFVIAAGACLYFVRPDSAFFLSLYQPTILLAAQAAVFIPLWKKSIRIKADNGWEVHNIGTSQTASAGVKGRLKEMPRAWYIICTALCVLAVVSGFAVYPSIPDTIVTHWNGNMEADAWAAKSLTDVFIMPLIAFGMILIMLGSNIILYFTKLQVSLENPVLSYAQHKLYRRMMSHMLGFITLIMTLMFILMMPMVLNVYVPSTTVMYSGIFVLTILILIPPVWLSVKAGQAGSKLKPVLTLQEEKEMKEFSTLSFGRAIDRGDDSYWKLGIFYYNRADPSLFVEDRFGSNGGINLAKAAGKIIVAVLVILVLATYGFSTLLFLTMM